MMTLDKPRRMFGRQLSEEDWRLWNAVVRSIKPLRRPRPGDLDDSVPEAPVAAAHPPSKVASKPPSKPPSKPAARGHAAAREGRPVPAPSHAVPALSPLARRERQRLARGGAPIEARIDLHGLTQSEAHAALARFLRRAQADGVKFALVITGKGSRFGEAGNDRGVLRRQVPLWLRLPEFRPYVVGFEDAHTAHGGQGALYVRIRRARGDP